MRQFLLLHLILNPRRAISLAHSKSKLLNSSVKKEFFKSKYSVPSLSKRSDDLVWLGSGRSNGKKKSADTGSLCRNAEFLRFEYLRS